MSRYIDTELKVGREKPDGVSIAKACKIGHHGRCFSLKCSCSCHSEDRRKGATE